MTNANTAANDFHAFAPTRMETKESIRSESVEAKNSTSEEKQDFTHKEVFGELYCSKLTKDQALSYLEISASDFESYLASKKLIPCSGAGNRRKFSVLKMKEFKRKLKEEASKAAMTLQNAL